MAGQRAVQAFQAAPIESGYINLMVTPTAVTGRWTVIGYTDRKIVIEDVKMAYGTANGGALTGGIAYVTETQKTADATLATNTPVTALTSTGSVDLNTTTKVKYSNTLVGSTNGAVPTANIVPASCYLVLALSAAPTSLANLMIQIRYSTVTQ